MQNICTFIYIKNGTSVQDTEAVRKTPTTYPKEKFLIYHLLGSQKKEEKRRIKEICDDKFHNLEEWICFPLCISRHKIKQNYSGCGVSCVIIGRTALLCWEHCSFSCWTVQPREKRSSLILPVKYNVKVTTKSAQGSGKTKYDPDKWHKEKSGTANDSFFISLAKEEFGDLGFFSYFQVVITLSCSTRGQLTCLKLLSRPQSKLSHITLYHYVTTLWPLINLFLLPAWTSCLSGRTQHRTRQVTVHGETPACVTLMDSQAELTERISMFRTW